MCAASGKERTIDEYSRLLERADWKYIQALHPPDQFGLMGVIEGGKL
jgi:hypothetical protein